MATNAKNPISQLLSTKFVRRLADNGLRNYARIRTHATDQLSLAETQNATLFDLLRRARHTQFGRDHDFAGIRSLADYQERVPLRDYESFWQTYWRTDFPRLNNVTWPGAIPYVALSSGTTSGTTKYIPVSREMLRSNRRAAITTLAWFRAAYPQVPLLTGQTFFLGGSTDLRPAQAGLHKRPGKTPGPLMGDLSGIAAKEISSLWRPYTFPSLDLALSTDWEQKLQVMAERGVRLPITAITGVPSWLLVLFERLRKVTGLDTIAEVWPALRLVIHGGTAFAPYRSLFREVIGSDDVHFLETYPASEGFVAAEDPRYGLLRLIPDHGIFFEFVPVHELGAANPIRHTVADLVPGIQYAVVLSTCAGLWSYVLGDTVCFETRDPPLLRFTGRTRQFLSAFGEHLIGEEIERAVATAAAQTAASIRDFHVGPVFPPKGLSRNDRGHSTECGATLAGRHRFFIEFAKLPEDLGAFGRALDASLSDLNEDYRAHRHGDLTLLQPDVVDVPRGGFANWMKSRGKLGGQHKVPRMDNSGELTVELGRWFCEEVRHDLSRAS